MTLRGDKLRRVVIAHQALLSDQGLIDKCWGWGAQKIEKAAPDEKCQVCGHKVKLVNQMKGGARMCAGCAFLSADHLEVCLVVDGLKDAFDDL